jgi:hypothetical protein
MEYNAIYWGTLDLGTLEFSGYTWIPGASDSTPALAASADGLYLVVRGTDNNVYYRVYNGSAWTEWAGIPGATLYEPAVAVYQGKLHIAIVGMEYNAIYWGTLDLGTLEFSGYTWIPGASDSTPALAA